MSRIDPLLMPALKPCKEEKTIRCKDCGASRDYIKSTKNGYRCSICGKEWERSERTWMK